ncbi:MAG: PIN domain-containing protein [Nitrososphaerales archaeon]
MAKVLLDASLLIIMASKPLNLIKELEETLGKTELLVLEDTINELEAINKMVLTKKSKQAKLALDFVKGIGHVSYSREGSTDDKILSYAIENELAVATMDKELRRRSRAMGLTVITLRGDRLMIDGPIQ